MGLIAREGPPKLKADFGDYLSAHLSVGATDPVAEIYRRKRLSRGIPMLLGPAGPLRDDNFGGIVGVVYGLMERTGGDGWIAVRHLVAALMVDAPETLVDAGARLPELRDEFLKNIANFCPDDDLAAWREILADVGTATAGPVRRPQVRAGFRPDDLAGKDQLGITNDVNMLCDVLAASDSEPPLSVGLFGDWGTGKSFFMRQMESRMNDLMKVAREEERHSRKSAYCSNIVQIRFNAWSYLDANLWANLALGIFEKLASPPSDPGADLDWEAEEEDRKRIEGERQKLLAKLETFRELKAEVALEKKQAETQKQQQQVATELARVTNEREEKAKELANVRTRDMVATLAEDPEVKAARDAAAATLGLRDLKVGELRSLAADLSGLPARLRTVWKLVKEQKAEKAVVGAAVLFGVALVVGLALLWGPGRLRIAGAASFVASVAGVLTAFARWVRPAVAKTSELIDRLEQGGRRGEERAREFRDKQSQETAVLEEQLRALVAKEPR